MQPHYLFSGIYGRVHVAAEPPPPLTRDPRSRIPAETVAAILAYWGQSIPRGRYARKSANGVTMAQTAKRFHVAINTVRKIIAERDGKCRK